MPRALLPLALVAAALAVAAPAVALEAPDLPDDHDDAPDVQFASCHPPYAGTVVYVNGRRVVNCIG